MVTATALRYAHKPGVKPAKALHDRQRFYDNLHHRKMVEHFMTDTEEHGFSRLRMIELHSRGMYRTEICKQSTNAVDISNKAYLAELEAWGTKTGCFPA